MSIPIQECPECGFVAPCKCEKRKNPTYGELFAAGKFDDSTMKTKSDNYCRCSKCIEQEEETTPDQQVEFVYQLSEIVAPITGDAWMVIHASAFARAKAFLRTVGKWKEA